MKDFIQDILTTYKWITSKGNTFKYSVKYDLKYKGYTFGNANYFPESGIVIMWSKLGGRSKTGTRIFDFRIDNLGPDEEYLTSMWKELITDQIEDAFKINE